MFLNKIRNIFCQCHGHKICDRNKCCARGQTGKHLCRQQCVHHNVSSFARALRILRRNVNTSNFILLLFNIFPAGYTHRAFIKLKNLGNMGCENWKYVWFYTCFRFIFWKWHFLDSRFKNFLGSMPLDPSRGSRLRRSFLWTSPYKFYFLSPPLQITLRRPWLSIITYFVRPPLEIYVRDKTPKNFHSDDEDEK